MGEALTHLYSSPVQLTKEKLYHCPSWSSTTRASGVLLQTSWGCQPGGHWPQEHQPPEGEPQHQAHVQENDDKAPQNPQHALSLPHGPVDELLQLLRLLLGQLPPA